jgi:hypothetical protein
MMNWLWSWRNDFYRLKFSSFYHTMTTRQMHSFGTLRDWSGSVFESDAHEVQVSLMGTELREHYSDAVFTANKMRTMNIRIRMLIDMNFYIKLL